MKMKFSIILALISYFFCHSLQANTQETKFFALLIGIDKYKNLPQRFWLDGCKNDTKLISHILTKRFAVLPKNITTLHDEEATRKSILGHFETILKKVKMSGEHTKVLFFYSGHGSQKKDQDGDEVDGTDETLVAYDSTLDGQADVLDDEIHIFLRKLVAIKAHVTVILDCCHSGTGIRTATKARSLNRKIEGLKNSANIKKDPAIPGVVFISACQPHEKEIEYYSAESNKTFGLLTYHFAKALQKEGAGATYHSIFKHIKSSYIKLPQAPSPTLEGESSKLVFGIKSQPLPPIFKVASFRRKKLINLDGGMLRGITVGSIFCLVKRAKQIFEKNSTLQKHVLVKIVKNSSFKSTARIISKKEKKILKKFIDARFFKDNGSLKDVLVGWEAVELIHNHGNFRLNLYIENEIWELANKKTTLKGRPLNIKQLPLSFQKTLQNLSKKNIIRLVDDIKHADAILRLGKEIAVVVWAQNSSSALKLKKSGSYEPQGFGPIPLINNLQNTLLENILIQFNKARNLLFLAPPKNYLNVSARLVKIARRGFYWQSAGSISSNQKLIPTLPHLTKFGIEFTNKSKKAVYATIIHIDSDLEISVLYPPRGRFSRIQQGQTKLLVPLQINASKSFGRETVKVLVTTVAQDFRELELQRLSRTRAATRSFTEKSTLGSLIFQAMFGQKRQADVGMAIRGAAILKPPPQWTTMTLAWETRR